MLDRCASRCVRSLAALAVLLLLCGPAPAAAACDPAADYDSLAAAFTAAEQGGDLSRALELAACMNELAEERHVEILYDLARLNGLQGNRAKAYEWLQRAADAGFWDALRMREDEAFATLREEALFRNTVRRAWANGYIAMLERPEREEFQRREQILAELAFREGERVADVGAGSGYFTIPVARAVGSTGTVIAADISQEMLDYLDKRVQAENLTNVQLLKVERDDPLLPPGGVDTILMVDTLHYVKNRGAYAKKLRAALAPGGRLVIIDYIPRSWEERPWGPPPEQQMSRETVDAEMAEGGLKQIKVYDFLPEQYFVVYGAE